MCYSVLCTFYLRTNAKIAKNSLMNHHYCFLKLFGYSGIANFHRGRQLNSIGLDFCTGKCFCMLLSRMQLLRHEQVVKFSKFGTDARSSISFISNSSREKLQSKLSAMFESNKLNTCFTNEIRYQLKLNRLSI